MNNFEERRKLPRVEVNWPVILYENDDIIEGESNNISMEGISMRCDKPLPINHIFRISIQPPQHQSIGVTGKVIWSDLYGMDDEKVFGVGVCLVEVAEEDRKTLEDLITNYL